MGDAAAIPHHHRRGAQAPQAPQAAHRCEHDLGADLEPGDWLEVFSRIAAGVRQAVLPLSGTEAGRAAHSTGAGGDITVEVDRVAEVVVFAELATVVERGEKFSVLSEEAGHRSFGADYPLILVDPVDGSLNAKQGVPLFGLMLALLDGPTVADVKAGFVMNLATGEEWTAIRQHGARRAGKLLRAMQRSHRKRIELFGLESSPRSIQLAQPLVERSSKIRILGSMALSIALTAAGGFDVFCAPIPRRVFDMAASLLMLAEAGGVATDLRGATLDDLRCDLKSRSTLLCGSSPELHEEAIALLSSR